MRRNHRRATAKGWLIGLVAVAAVAVVAKFTVFNNGGADYEIQIVVAEEGPLVMTIETSGTVEPLSVVQVGCETTGKIIEIAVDHDEPVTKGQIICRIDPELVDAQHQQSIAEQSRATSALTEARLAVEEQTANLPIATQQALATLQEAEAAFIDAEYQYNRIKELFEADDAAEGEWTAIQAQYKRAEAAVTVGKATHQLAKNNEVFLLKRAAEAVGQAEAAEKLALARFNFTKAQVEKCIIRSPIDGIVLKRFMDVGATVNAQFQAPQLFLLAPSLDHLRVNAKVSESDIVHVDKGQIASFTIEARGRKSFEGRILEKRSQPDIIQNVVTYTVIFEVDNNAARTLLPGLTVNVEIECVNRPQVVKIPNSALRFKPPLDLEKRREMKDAATWPARPAGSADGPPLEYCEKSQAWTFNEADGSWRLVPLWIGITDNLYTEVLSGAKPDDAFVKRFKIKESSGFSLQNALKQADPANRVL